VQFKAQTPLFKFSSWLLCITWNLVTFIIVFWWSFSTAFMYTPKHMKLWSSSFSQDGQRMQRIYISLGVLWFSLLVSFLATLAFKRLRCTCFWIWWKLMGVCDSLLHECVNIPHYLTPEHMWFSSRACWSPLCRYRYTNWIQYPILNPVCMNAEGYV
jgi:hypothetical protein